MNGDAAATAGAGVTTRLPVTQALAAFCAAQDFNSLPAKAVETAKLAMADLLGCALAGTQEEVCRNVLGSLPPVKEGAQLWGQTLTTAIEDAVLYNGIAGHALALDDTNESMRGHPSAPIVPALFALGQQMNASGRALIAAYTVGVEVACKLGRMINDTHTRHGWHTSATLGTVGAAAASSRLLGLNPERTRNALGISTSLASGIRGNFGSMVKPLMVGVAARNGVLAARMVQAGVTARADAIETHEGFIEVFAGGNGADIGAILASLGKPWELEDKGLVFKLYPNCSLMHTGIDMAIEERRAGRIAPEDIASIRFEISPRMQNMRFAGVISNAQEARFKIEFCLAYALLHGKLDADAFADVNYRDPRIVALMDRIEIAVGTDFPEDNGDYSRLHVSQHRGPAFSGSRDKQKGHPSNPLSIDELRSKFAACCASAAFAPERAERVWNSLMALESREGEEIYRLLAGNS